MRVRAVAATSAAAGDTRPPNHSTADDQADGDQHHQRVADNDSPRRRRGRFAQQDWKHSCSSDNLAGFWPRIVRRNAISGQDQPSCECSPLAPQEGHTARRASRLRLQAPQIRHQVALLLVRQLQRQHQVEELDRVLQRQQPAVVMVRRRILDAAERERLDRPVLDVALAGDRLDRRRTAPDAGRASCRR